MSTYTSKINKKRQVTLPREILTRLNIKAGDQLRAVQIDKETKTIELEPEDNTSGLVLQLKLNQ
ncbi:MAG: AbrB/MazE/SpoVT family DNA-binding domain-containing protein [Patescibacteria group bacterium]